MCTIEGEVEVFTNAMTHSLYSAKIWVLSLIIKGQNYCVRTLNGVGLKERTENGDLG